MKIKKFGELGNTNLPQKWVNHLQNLPETGMGYQIVDITTPVEVFKSVKIINCQTIKSEQSIPVEDITDIELSN